MRRLFSLLFAVATATVLGACGAASTQPSGGARGSTTLRLAFQADMSVPDPDVFYDVEGNVVTLSTYEGLVGYAPDSTTIVPQLATSWTVSADRRTYTFTLHRGVTFHDGTPMTSKSVKASIERRKALNAGSGYMVADVDKITTPDDSTVVLHLDHPVGAFLDYLASTWGPKVIGPSALVTHAGTDHGQAWLSTHDDGTGPYQLTAFERGRQYRMAAFPTYWGTAPFFKSVLISITPSMSSQQLELKNGDLDAILHSYPPSELAQAKADPNLQVVEKPAFNRTMLYVNTHKITDPAARAAIGRAIDVKQITAAVYGATAKPADGPYPAGMLAGQPALPALNPSPVKGRGGNLVLAYGPDSGGLLRTTAELVQIDLAKLGYSVTLVGVQLPQTFDYKKDPAKAPDLLLLTPVPDAAHPDTWAQPFWATNGGINDFGTVAPAIDKLLPQAAAAPAGQAAALYRTIGQDLVNSGSVVSIADVNDTIVLRKDLTGIEHSPAYEWYIRLAALRRG